MKNSFKIHNPISVNGSLFIGKVIIGNKIDLIEEGGIECDVPE